MTRLLHNEPKVRRWTKSEYHEAAELGWFNGQRVELIGGEVVQMAPQRDAHAMAVRLVDRALREAFKEGYWVCVQMPLNLGRDSEPEPDLAVVRGTPRRLTRHPKSAVLVVEVSDTTLGFDRKTKSRLYASANIREYWVVNLIDRQLEVRHRPIRDDIQPFGFTYGDLTVLRPGETVTPIAARKVKIKVSDLLP